MDSSMGMSQGSDSNTGTRDVTYDLTAVLYHALQGVENCRTYMGDAEGKQEHRQFFQMAMDSQRQLAEQVKKLLHDCLMEETGGNGASGSQTMAGQSGGMTDRQDISSRDVERMGSGESRSFNEARDDDSAFRFASSQTEGGTDQFAEGQDSQRQTERPTSGGAGSSF